MIQDTISKKDSVLSESSKKMIEVGVFYGRKKSKTNPKMRKFVYGSHNGFNIIDIQKTEEMLEEALKFIKEKAKNNSLFLFVGTEPSAEDEIISIAKGFDMPYVVDRWIGGTITNFSIISKRVEFLKSTREALNSGSLGGYTKKERLDMEKDIAKLEKLMGGLENLSKVPDVLIVINPVSHLSAVREANKSNIPVVALANIDADPDMLSYCVPGNDKAKNSIAWFLENIKAAIEEGIKERANVAHEPVSK
jgi:small subunit ribosomal protein S2